MTLPAAAPSRPTALIVEDQPPFRSAVRDLVAIAFPAARVVEAFDGISALASFAECRPALVVMDIGLPDADGIELAARLLSLAPETVVVVMSIDDSARTRHRALAAGAAAFIPKDSLFAHLEPMLRALNAVAVCKP